MWALQSIIGLFYNTLKKKESYILWTKKDLFCFKWFAQNLKNYKIPSKFRTTEAYVHFKVCKHRFSRTISTFGSSNLPQMRQINLKGVLKVDRGRTGLWLCDIHWFIVPLWALVYFFKQMCFYVLPPAGWPRPKKTLSRVLTKHKVKFPSFTSL